MKDDLVLINGSTCNPHNDIPLIFVNDEAFLDFLVDIISMCEEIGYDNGDDWFHKLRVRSDRHFVKKPHSFRNE